jgi:hypothetical protein
MWMQIRNTDREHKENRVLDFGKTSCLETKTKEIRARSELKSMIKIRIETRSAILLLAKKKYEKITF